MQICRRLAVVRREVKKLAAIAEKRSVEAERRAAPGFRQLTEAEPRGVWAANCSRPVAPSAGALRS